MIFTHDNLKFCLGVTPEQYVAWRDTLAKDGFRTLSLSLAGSAWLPRYTAVMVRHDRVFRGQSWPRLERDELDEMIARMAKEESLHPYVIAATGSGGHIFYAAAFREMDQAPIVRPDLTLAQYRSEHAKQRAAGRILLSVDAFGDADEARYCAVWASNPDRVAWNADSADDQGTARQQRFDALTSVRARESLLAMTPTGGLVRLFVDSRLKHSWSARGNLSAAEMQELIAEQAAPATRRFPVCIGTTTVESALRCSAIFAESDEIIAREWRIRGPEPIGLDPADSSRAQALDGYMKDYVHGHNLRGAALAIVEGTRLVYAKGYTLAEPDAYYSDITPTTLFRMASASKTFCAVAVWRALAGNPHVSRNSKMQAVLGLKQPDGSPAADARFADITIRHLLESNSGIDQGSVRDLVIRVKADWTQLQPLNSTGIASRIAAKDLLGEPGGTLANGKQATQYGHTDYFLLGLVAARLAEASSFEAALQRLVLEPLKMTRTRGSRSRIEDRGADEAIHHLPALETGASAVHNDRRTVPTQYGDENYEVYDGAGGLSSAVVDVARLCAMLSCRTGNPLFTDDMLDTFLSAAVAATAAGTDHGYHGFDSAVGSYPGITCIKRGSNPGGGAGFWGRTGRRFIIIVRNGEKLDGATVSDTWYTDLDAIAATIDWKGADLFPRFFGMPAL